MPAETPIFVVFGDFEWAQKRTIFQKQIVATKMRGFFTFRTQIVFANFSKKCHFCRKKTSSLFTTTQKHYFWGGGGIFFFEIFVFHFFHIFSFSFSNIKKTKTKSAHFFFENPFLTPRQTAKTIFAPLHTICVFCF